MKKLFCFAEEKERKDVGGGRGGSTKSVTTTELFCGANDINVNNYCRKYGFKINVDKRKGVGVYTVVNC